MDSFFGKGELLSVTPLGRFTFTIGPSDHFYITVLVQEVMGNIFELPKSSRSAVMLQWRNIL